MFKTLSIAPVPATASASVLGRLLPLMAVVLTAFLVIGLALPVLPLHVHHGLGLGTFAVGLVAGSQFAAALLSRMWAGRFSDTQGARRAVVCGLCGAAAAGLLYLVSLAFAASPLASVSILLLGRAVLGAAESFIITGALAWGLGLAGPTHTGKVIAWVGMAMYAAFALGAPLGTILYEREGFMAIALATTLLPLGSLLLVATMQAVPVLAQTRPSFLTVITAVWVPGFGLALSSAGFGAVMAFIGLLFAERGWNPAWLAVTVFAGAFILARALLGHLADRIGGAKVALVSVLIEAGGQVMVWQAAAAWIAVLGAAITGLGYALVYPALGVEAVELAPIDSKGLAMGAYTSFLDLALGIASPLMGLVAARAGLGAVFLASAVCALGAAGIVWRLLRSSDRRVHSPTAAPCAP